jgi:hypothetical protein
LSRRRGNPPTRIAPSDAPPKSLRRVRTRTGFFAGGERTAGWLDSQDTRIPTQESEAVRENTTVVSHSSPSSRLVYLMAVASSSAAETCSVSTDSLPFWMRDSPGARSPTRSSWLSRVWGILEPRFESRGGSPLSYGSVRSETQSRTKASITLREPTVKLAERRPRFCVESRIASVFLRSKQNAVCGNAFSAEFLLR